jgi:hypothetical protein
MTQPEHEEFVYAAAVVILSSELYPRKLEIVREYVQNASDAIDSFTQISDAIDDTSTPQIKISIQGRSLLIWDNGIGMDGKEIAKLRLIAYSEKREGQEAGYKGIGRLAGIAVAEKLLISSTSFGDPKLHKFEFRAKDFQDDISAKKREGIQEPATAVINRHTEISEYDVDLTEHYTLVELRGVDDAYPELLDPVRLREFIGEIGPVGFAPDFTYGKILTEKLYENVPDYSPKTIWLTTTNGDRLRISKPYNNEMSLSSPDFIKITDPKDGKHCLAYCWYATRGKEMLGKMRPAGNKFVVEGISADARKRYASLAYKLFGFSIGDRSLPLRTLWHKDWTRALWFTGEIHIVDKTIKPTTDRSDFVDNASRQRLYSEGQEKIGKELNRRAQDISNVRKAHDTAGRWDRRFSDIEKQLNRPGEIDREEVKSRKDELNEALQDLDRQCKDNEVSQFVKDTTQRARTLQRRFDEAKNRKSQNGEIGDLAKELQMTSQARKVYKIIMETLSHHFKDEKEIYYEISSKIRTALKSRY